jgi:hypothetical protein
MLEFKQYLNEMAKLIGRGKDPNADEKEIENIFSRVQSHPNKKERDHYTSHPEGIKKFAEKHLMTGNNDRDTGTRIAANAAQQLMNHKSKKHGSVRSIIRTGGSVKRSGATAATVRPEYSSLGGKNSTSRADIAVFDKKGKQKHTISVKKDDAQVASAESGEFRSLGHAAADRLHPKVRDVVKKKVDAISKMQKASSNAKSDEEYKSHAKKANASLQRLRRDHPEWEHHVAREAATGHAKFGKDSSGSADNMLSYNGKTGEAKMWNSENEGSPYSNGLKMEIRTGKGRKGKRNPKDKPGTDSRARRQAAFRVEPKKNK